MNFLEMKFHSHFEIISNREVHKSEKSKITAATRVFELQRQDFCTILV